MLQFVGPAGGAPSGGTPATPQLEALEGHEEHFQVTRPRQRPRLTRDMLRLMWSGAAARHPHSGGFNCDMLRLMWTGMPTRHPHSQSGASAASFRGMKFHIKW